MEQLAEQSCAACKRLKRRCDKVLPKCSLCSRRRRDCEYSSANNIPPTAADLAAIKSRMIELEQRVEYSNASATQLTPTSTASSSNVTHTSSYVGQAAVRVPLTFFLDFDYFKLTRMRLPKPEVEIPSEILAMLTKGNTIVETAEKYFDTIHVWMPIISKKRMMLGLSMHDRGADHAMLFMAMKLMTSDPGTDEAQNTYALCKAFLTHLERAALISQACLQAMLLVGLYEYGQAIYPAAWMTVGACVRYSDMLGLSCCGIARGTLGDIISWNEAEERRRLWWGIFILDRLSSLSCGRAAAMRDPPDQGTLPWDDKAWDTGGVRNGSSYSVLAEFHTYRSPFADLCRIVLFAGQVLAHAQFPARSSIYHSRSRELMTMLWKLDELDDGCHHNDEDFRKTQLLAFKSVVKSAQFVLWEQYTCPGSSTSAVGSEFVNNAQFSDEAELQRVSVDCVSSQAMQVHSLCTGMLTGVKAKTSRVQGMFSPFSFNMCFQALATLHWLHGESGDVGHGRKIKALEGYLETFGNRWSLAREYVELSKNYAESHLI